MDDKKLYLYYSENGNKIHLADFTFFDDLISWCKAHCTRNQDSYYFNGNKVLCGYHLDK